MLTAHDVLPREPRPGQRRAQCRLYDRVDALVVHTRHGRARLMELGVDAARIHVIPHGPFTHFTGTQPLPDELASVRGPVVLFFGLLRPYKGLDVLVDAWRGIEDAELWIVGLPRMDTAPLRAAAPSGVRFVERYVPEAQVPAFFRRADLVALPYREIDQSGVLATALGFRRPLLLSDAGGFPEVKGAEIVPRGDAAALHDALAALLADPVRRAAATPLPGPSWDGIARAHLDLYARLAP